MGPRLNPRVFVQDSALDKQLAKVVERLDQLVVNSVVVTEKIQQLEFFTSPGKTHALMVFVEDPILRTEGVEAPV